MQWIIEEFARIKCWSLSTWFTLLLISRWWGWSSSLSSYSSSFLTLTARRSPDSSCLWSSRRRYQPTGNLGPGDILYLKKRLGKSNSCYNFIPGGFDFTFIWINTNLSMILSTILRHHPLFFMWVPDVWMISVGRLVSRSFSSWGPFSAGKRTMIQYRKGLAWF